MDESVNSQLAKAESKPFAEPFWKKDESENEPAENNSGDERRCERFQWLRDHQFLDLLAHSGANLVQGIFDDFGIAFGLHRHFY